MSMNRESLRKHCEKMCKMYESAPSSNAYMEHKLVLDLLDQTEWIPISERLPEIHQDVLLSLRSLDVEVGFRSKAEPYFYCQSEGSGYYIEPQNVLAWQPRPQPYKAESEDEE